MPQRQNHLSNAGSASGEGVAVLSQVVKDLVESLIIKKPQMAEPVPVTPKSSLRYASPNDSSPIPPSPSHLGHFLKYANEKLGVRDALVYLSPMSRKGYGPDILAEVPVPDLTDPTIGLTPGDAIRLKRGSVDWWSEESKKTRNPKRPRSHTILTPLFPDERHTEQNQLQPEAEQLPDNSISYHIEYPDGGGKRWFAGPLLRRGRPRDDDKITEYFDKARKEWLPIPVGFTAPLEPGEELDPFDDM
jgi:hypothetical protein